MFKLPSSVQSQLIWTELALISSYTAARPPSHPPGLPPGKQKFLLIVGKYQDDLTGRQPNRKETSQEENLTGRQPHRKTTTQDDDLTERRPGKKMT